MALTGIQIFKLTPKKNCKECGSPTCMAFAMKVAQGAVSIDKCPHMSEDAIAQLSEASAPPMKTIEIGKKPFADNKNDKDAAYKLGGETVLFRHEKTFVNKTRYASTAVSYTHLDVYKRQVLAADVDPDANLGLALGFSEEELDSIVPISKMRKLIQERTGADATNTFFKMNPKVDDIPDLYAKTCNGVKLLTLGTVETGGSGCVRCV